MSELLDNYSDIELDLNVESLPPALQDDTTDSEKCLLAKSYFDLKEYYRASHVLKSATSQKALFLKNYSLYLVCILFNLLYLKFNSFYQGGREEKT